MNDFLQTLRAKAGRFRGEGINHEGENFTGELTIRAAFIGVALYFCATGSTGEVLHEEDVLIAPAPDGGLSMASLNSNLPFLQIFGSETVEKTAASFIHGNFSAAGFRERVTLRFDADGSLHYAFEWGMPGASVEPRSRVIMTPC